MTREHERWYPLSIVLISAGYLSYAISKAVFILCALSVALLLIPFPATRRKLLQAMLHQFLGFFTRSWLPLLGVYRVGQISGQPKRCPLVVHDSDPCSQQPFVAGPLPKLVHPRGQGAAAKNLP